MFGLFRRGRSQLKITIAGATHPGGHREHNEDAFRVIEDRQIAVIADGMGGLARGEVASSMVVDTVSEALLDGHSASDGLQAAHRKIREASMSGGMAERMGSTAVVLQIDGGKAQIDWIGDSRAYLWRGDALKQLSKDHSFVEELIDAGAISPEDAETHPNRNVLTRAVGIRDTAEIRSDSTTLDLKPGDCILLCTDGLHGYLPQPLLLDGLRQGGGARAIAERLVERTLADTDAGDNVTVVCAAVED